jgi:hypothetical protein
MSVSVNHTGGASGGSTRSNSFQIQYDAASQSYLLTSDSLVKTFGPANRSPLMSPGRTVEDEGLAYTTGVTIIPSVGGKGLAVYDLEPQSTINATHDPVEQLILTSNSNPILSASPPNLDITLTYVGFGAWISGFVKNIAGPSISGSMTYFAYGAFTRDDQLPRSGSGSYLFVLDGRLFTTQAQYFVFGNGSLVADFSAGSINMNVGNTWELNPAAPIGSPGSSTSGAFAGSASLSSTTNSFSGTFAYQGRANVNGALQGRFFGPHAEEVGAVFSGQNTDAVIVGALVGQLGVGGIH